jgi:hypothetical protein
MAAAMATYGKVPMTCRTCTSPDAEDLRRTWGCDSQAPEALFEVDCPRCYGSHAECELCGGSGSVPVHRCPWATRTRVIGRVLDYSSLLECGVLPVGGGWEDQSATFADALSIVLRTRARIEEQKMEEERRRRG